MQERRLRLGDVLDDYCPREKRLSNHVIVALVDDEVRTTRCATCDFEHVYKEGKVPARRKKADPQATLYKTVLENITGRDAESGAPLPPTVEADVACAGSVAMPPAPPRLAPAARLPSRRRRCRWLRRLLRTGRRTASRGVRAPPYPHQGDVAQDRGAGARAQAGRLHPLERRATSARTPRPRWRASAPAASGR